MISGLCVELLSGVLMSAVRESGPERLGRKKKRLKNNFFFSNLSIEKIYRTGQRVSVIDSRYSARIYLPFQ